MQGRPHSPPVNGDTLLTPGSSGRVVCLSPGVSDPFLALVLDTYGLYWSTAMVNDPKRLRNLRKLMLALGCTCKPHMHTG